MTEKGELRKLENQTQRPNLFLDYGVHQLIGALLRWAADQRERQGWHDEDEATYRYCADLLDAAAERIARLTP